jgi:small GTP-binding protein
MEVLLFKIITLGEPKAIKQVLIKKNVTGYFLENTKMTVGVDYKIKRIRVNQQEVKLQIWDISWEEHFNMIRPNFFAGAKGALLLYDVANRSTLTKINDWLDAIRKYVREDIPIILAGIILKQAKDREIPTEEGKKIAMSKKITAFLECNIKTGKNVEEIFVKLAKLILKKYT